MPKARLSQLYHMGRKGGALWRWSGSRGPYDKADDIKHLGYRSGRTVWGPKEHHFPTGELTSCGTAKANRTLVSGL